MRKTMFHAKASVKNGADGPHIANETAVKSALSHWFSSCVELWGYTWYVALEA